MMFWFGLTIGLIVGVFSGVAFVSLMIAGNKGVMSTVECVIRVIQLLTWRNGGIYND